MLGSAVGARVAAKVAPWLLLVAVVLGLAVYVESLRWSRDSAQAAAAVAQGEVVQARAAAQLAADANKAALAAVTMQAAADRRRASDLEHDLEAIRDAKHPIPAACRDALRPLAVLADQLRGAAVPAGPGGAAAAARPVHAGAAAAGQR